MFFVSVSEIAKLGGKPGCDLVDQLEYVGQELHMRFAQMIQSTNQMHTHRLLSTRTRPATRPSTPCRNSRSSSAR